eukprot:PhF_6_TR18878/c7_g1_i1/m.27480
MCLWGVFGSEMLTIRFVVRIWIGCGFGIGWSRMGCSSRGHQSPLNPWYCLPHRLYHRYLRSQNKILLLAKKEIRKNRNTKNGRTISYKNMQKKSKQKYEVTKVCKFMPSRYVRV